MSILLFKSFLSIAMVILPIVAMFTMFEMLGRAEKKYNLQKLKKIHKANGIVYFLIFIFIAYFCISAIVALKSEPSSRHVMHSLFALTIIILFGVKISFIRIYRQFYNQVKTIGLLIALLTFGLVGTSGGYYLLVTEFGTDKAFYKTKGYKEKNAHEIIGEKDKGIKIIVKTDFESIKKGKELFETSCSFCHNAYSTDTIVGPGMKSVLKNPTFPVSKKPATPENIVSQIRNPYRDMPSFAHLPQEDILNLIAYLNTL